MIFEPRAVSIHLRFPFILSWSDVGGNQRDKDREKAQKKAAANAKKPKESASSLQQRKEK